MSELTQRAREIAAFLDLPEDQCIARLQLGFGEQHKRVNDDFRRANPKTDDELLAWYRTTDSYIWELSAYHMDPGFNYSGMCGGIAERLKVEGVRSVLCLGDGIGDLTLTLAKQGFEAWYHDLHDSRTMRFAASRFRSHGVNFRYLATPDFEPGIVIDGIPFDAVVSLDFLEHVNNVPEWVQAIHETLEVGGLFGCQNAFDCGSGPDGAIPCHLAVNDKFAHAAPHTNGMALWDWMLREIGFEQLGPQWYRRKS